jgi:hypothetical protein
MLDTLLWIAVGAFIGWNMPQPSWAKLVQARIIAMINKK